VLASAAACGGWEVGQEQGPAREGGAASSDCPKVFDPDLAEEKEPHRGFHVVENRIQNSEGRAVMLRGVNRSGGEYQCTKGTGFFDGAANEEAVRAMARWKINAVRVPLNETCWLAGGGLSQGVSGENYKQAIMTYVAFLKRYGLSYLRAVQRALP
jgi:endoglucanase